MKVRDARLEWMQVMRGTDLMLGLPHNLVQFTTLHEIMAGWLGLDMGPFTLVTDSLHAYERDLPALATASTTEVPTNEDRLDLPRAASTRAVARFVGAVRSLAADELRPGQLHMAAESCPEAPAYANLIRVAAADSARRRGWHADANEVMRACTNCLLAAMWHAWQRRWSDR